MKSNNPVELEVDKILFDCIVAVGVRENGTVRDLDTLIIDRQKATQELTKLINKARIDELQAIPVFEVPDEPNNSAQHDRQWRC